MNEVFFAGEQIPYHELQKICKDLQAQIAALQAENERLKRQLDISTPTVQTETLSVSDCHIPAVTMRSTPAEKIRLFRSIFSGRENAFARRWYSVKTEKSGYQPVCGNEWAEGLCDKKKFKCSDCPNRRLLSLTEKDVFSHLAGKDPYGRDVIGIYPMLSDETCRFLCVDFDDADFISDATAFRKSCEAYAVPCSVERSRSGSGAHVWIFFSEPVPAVLARKLGTALLTKTMEENAGLSFKSYDRLFPNQDTIPKGGFGNLIALPMQGQARKHGNSMFVDEQFRPYDDPWAYLSCVQKLSMIQVEALVAALCKTDELGNLVSTSEDKPWEQKTTPKLSAFDFSNGLTVTRANLLYIPKPGLSPAARNTVKRLAAFKNPDFYRAQAMRLPVYNKPRIIATHEETKGFIGIPRGCEGALLVLLSDCNVNVLIDDKTNVGIVIPVSFEGVLREEQQLAVDTLLSYDTGTLCATTAFGKTVVAAAIIGARKTNTLVLVHTQSLMQQWKQSLERFLSFDVMPPEAPKGRGRRKSWSPVGMLGAGQNSLHGTVDVAVMQSLVHGDEVKALVRNYGMVIVDECHHVSAFNFEKILRFANAKYVYGLTATPTRQDGQHPIVFMQCGPIRYRVDAKTQAQKRGFTQILIPRFTSFRCLQSEKGVAAIYGDLAENERRNTMILQDVLQALKQGRNPIVLSERREHVKLLAERLKGQCTHIITLVGTASAKERRETMTRLSAIPENESLVILATGKYVGEGFDCPRLDTLFLALPISWKGKVAQYAGRLHRDYPGKAEVQLFDYVDIHVSMLERMYQKRLKGYASIGYQIRVDSTPQTLPELIYDGKSFYTVYYSDLEQAKREIIIVSPFLRKGRITQLGKALTKAVLNGVNITVITRPPESFSEKDRAPAEQGVFLLKDYGVRVQLKPDFHQKFTLIDQCIVWYGSINFLSFGTADESIMRFENEEIAGQLMDTVTADAGTFV